jgi:signal transduction histidine kinase/putative methionine-R-sulfoxide reductase with GAF domain
MKRWTGWRLLALLAGVALFPMVAVMLIGASASLPTMAGGLVVATLVTAAGLWAARVVPGLKLRVDETDLSALVRRANALAGRPAELYEWLTQWLAQELDADKCVLVMNSPRDRRGYRPMMPAFGHPAAEIESLRGRMVAAAVPLEALSRTVVFHSSGAEGRLDLMPGERSMMWTPVFDGAQRVGAIRVASQRRTLAAADALRMDALAREVTTALCNARAIIALEERLEEISFLYQVGTPLTGALEFEAAVSGALHAVQAGLDCDQVNLYLVDESDQVLRLHELSPGRPAGGEGRVPLGTGVVGEVAASGEPAQRVLDPGETGEGLFPEARAQLVVAVRLGTWVIGVVEALRSRPDAFDERDLWLLNMVAEQLATALQSSRLYDATRNRAAELSLLYDATVAISTAELDRSGLIELVMERLISATGVDGGRLALWQEGAGSLTTRYSSGNTLVDSPEIDRLIGARLANSRQPLTLYREDKRLEHAIAEAMGVRGVAAALILPLVANNRDVGLVELTRESSGRHLTQDEVRLAQTLATQAAIALENARLYQETKRALEELTTLQAMALDITAQVELPELLDRLMMRARSLVGAAGSAIYLRGTVDAKLVPAASFLPWGGTVLQQGLELARQAMEDARPLFRPIRPERAGRGANPPRSMICVCVPLRWHEQVLGVMSVFAGDEDGSVAARARYLLELLAPQAAIAIRNVQLFEALELRMAELERAQASLVQAEKAAAIGRLAASLAHEINNPLQSLNNCLHLARRAELTSDKKGAYLSMAQDEVRRLIEIVSRMLNFYRPATGESRVETDLNRLVHDVLGLVGQQLEQNRISTKLDLQPELPTILAIPNNVRQVLLNVILNAVDAMPDGGQLRISTEQQAGGWAGVTITDTGRGIPAEHVSQVFEPFFTTKENGTGLGLAISYGIIEAHGGHIDVESEVGKGSAFSIRFPPGNETVIAGSRGNGGL